MIHVISDRVCFGEGPQIIIDIILRATNVIRSTIAMIRNYLGQTSSICLARTQSMKGRWNCHKSVNIIAELGHKCCHNVWSMGCLSGTLKFRFRFRSQKSKSSSGIFMIPSARLQIRKRYCQLRKRSHFARDDAISDVIEPLWTLAVIFIFGRGVLLGTSLRPMSRDWMRILWF